MKFIISTHFFFLSKIVKAFLLIKCHAKGVARERGEGIRAGAGEAVYEIEKQEYNNGQGGILIEIDEGNAPDYSKLLFMINPGAQTYYLGMYNHSKSSWTSFTSPEANGGWVASSSLKGFSNKGVSTNKIRLQKTTDEITIYINDQLMFTQNIAASGRPLNKFAGLGIVQGGLMTGNISAINFKSE